MIITNNEELLRKPCENATEEEVGEIIQQLDNELKNSARLGKVGVGLAAAQIGIYKKIAIVRYDKFHLNLVNCNISNQYDPKIFTDEGCLSFPGRVENTMRFQEIVVSNNLVFPHNFIITGFPAVIVQHELDHLNSILLPDRALKKVNKKLGPNEKCFCGSGLKFKKCKNNHI